MVGLALIAATTMSANGAFSGRHIEGVGDPVFLQALDNAYAMTQPSSQVANLPLLYMREWNGLVEGPTWNMWWIQNSFGPSYTLMPFLQEPYRTWLSNSQKLWFDAMGNGVRADQNGFVAPEGSLCDAATPTQVYYRQGDGQVSTHDWPIGFTAAGLIMQAELMLVKRDPAEIAQMLPKLRKVAAFLDSRRDPKENLLLGGVASNLLAPSFGGWVRPDGTREKTYLAELSVNYVAGMRKLAEVCKLAGSQEEAKLYTERADLVNRALAKLTDEDGAFIQALNPDGTRKGVFGAAKNGYFETAPNHDAMCFRVADDEQSRKIYRKIARIPELRPHKLILPNYPGYDDMYENHGIFQYGTWINGGHWTTAEGRMMMGYFRVGAHQDALDAFDRIHQMARAFRADAPLVERSAKPYQPGQPYNVVYDCWGAPGAMLRGAIDLEYSAEGLRLFPQLPAGVQKLVQKYPVTFGQTRIWLSVAGSGPLTGVRVNGRPHTGFDPKSAQIPLDGSPGDIRVQLLLGDAEPFPAQPPRLKRASVPKDPKFWRITPVEPPLSGNQNRLCIGISPSGGYGFKGQIRQVRIYRRVLEAAELRQSVPIDPLARFDLGSPFEGSLKGGKAPELAARFEGKGSPQFAEGGLSLDGESGLAIPPSRTVDFQADFTLELWIRPDALPAGGARLIDRCTVGGEDGYNLDFINGGKTLRLINVTGIVQAPVSLKIGEWQHVAATCDQKGLMKLYLDGVQVGEFQGKPPVRAAQADAPVDLAKVGEFLRLLEAEGLADTYPARHARVMVDLVAALHERRRALAKGQTPPAPPAGFPPAKEESVDNLYTTTIGKLAHGLVDWLRAQPNSNAAAKLAKAAELK